MKKQFIIEVDESDIVKCWNEQAAKELGYQEYALKQCPKIKVKPYNPSGDLISREALKKAISELSNDNPSYYYTGDLLDRERVFDEIDNAQAVEVFTLEDMQNNYDLGATSEAAKHGRLHGEWIDRMADKGYVECPFCHKQITGGDLNFCVKCGADMRGDVENEEADE